MSNILQGATVSIGGKKIDASIVNFLAYTEDLVIGLSTAETLKKEVGSLYENDTLNMEITGAKYFLFLWQSHHKELQTKHFLDVAYNPLWSKNVGSLYENDTLNMEITGVDAKTKSPKSVVIFSTDNIINQLAYLDIHKISLKK